MRDANNQPFSSSNPSMETSPTYEIRVRGCLDRSFWSDIFEGMELTVDMDQGETILRGPITDQAELYGLLSRLRNQGLTLVAFRETTHDA